MTYPTWRCVRRGLWYSEEEMDGVPDYTLEQLRVVPYSGRRWWLKGRTSEQYSVFPTKKEAMDWVRNANKETER